MTLPQSDMSACALQEQFGLQLSKALDQRQTRLAQAEPA